MEEAAPLDLGQVLKATRTRCGGSSLTTRIHERLTDVASVSMISPEMRPPARRLSPRVLRALLGAGAVWSAGCGGGDSTTGGVTPPPPPVTVASVSVTPNSGSITIGAVLSLSATAKDQGGNTIAGKSFSWTSSSAEVASVSGIGVVTGVSAGTATIEAAVDGKQGLAVVTVNPMPVAPAIVTQPADQTVVSGNSVTFSVFASGSNPISYQWQRDNAPIAGATASSYTISATTRADSLATFNVIVSNTAGSVTSRNAKVTVIGPVYGLSGFRPTYGSGPNDLIAVRYRFKVIEDLAPTLHILFTFNGLHRPGSSFGYTIETNIYSNRLAYADGGCTTWPLLGTDIEGQASLRVATGDNALVAGLQPGPSTGISTGDPVGYPVQTYLVDNIPNYYKSDAISQFDITGFETQVTIQRGETLTNVDAFARCGRALIPGIYRKWIVSVEMVGRAPFTTEFIAPDANAHFLNTNQAVHVATEFLNYPGAVTVQYWDFAGMRESDPVWRPVNSFISNSLYDGNGRDFGVRTVNAGGQNRIEVSNRAGNSYFLKDVPFSY